MILFYCSGFAQTDSHSRAVNELVEVMHLKDQITESANRMLNLQIQAMPQMAPYKDTMSEFFKNISTGKRWVMI